MKLLDKEDSCLIIKKEGQTDQFTMADQNLFIGMYRDTIYKNKIRVIPQEEMGNARDAHREVGKEHVPIEVTLPTSLEPTLIIKDFGPGINTERSKIFSQYGASTKRDSDDQNGGFGIGCKCPWSYTETFIVETVCKEGDGKKFHRVYSLYITSKMDPGNIKIVSNKEVDDNVETFTKISIPIMDNDVFKIEESVLTTAAFWDVPPKITNIDNARSLKPEAVRSGKDWLLANDHDLFGIDGKSVAVVDGICYGLDLNILYNGRSQYEDVIDGEEGDVEEITYAITNEQRNILRDNRIFLFFNVNEVEVAPDRENLNYSVRTIKAISDKVGTAINELIDGVKKDVLTEDADFISIMQTIGAVCSKLDVELKWKDIDVIQAYKEFKNCRCTVVTIDEQGETDILNNQKVSWDLIKKENTAVLHYTSASGVKMAANRVFKYDKYFDILNVKAFVFFVLDGYHGISSFLTKYITTHKKISIPKEKTVSIKGEVDGVYLLSNDFKITNVDQIGKHALFVQKRFTSLYLGYDDPDRGRHIINYYLLSKIFPYHKLYSVSIVGERKLKKAGYKIRYVDDYIEKAIEAALKKSESDLYYCNAANKNDFEIDRICKNEEDILKWLVDNNKRKAFLAYKHYRKIKKINLRYSDSAYRQFIKLAKYLGFEIKLYNNRMYNLAVEIIKKEIPFIKIMCHDKKIMSNIIKSYKEF